MEMNEPILVVSVNKHTKTAVCREVVRLVEEKLMQKSPWVRFDLFIEDESRIGVNVKVMEARPPPALAVFITASKTRLDDFVNGLIDLHIFEKASSCVFWRAVELLLDLPITSVNCKRMLLICYLVAFKSLEDEIISNKAFAQLTGLTLDDINTMERTYLKYVNFDVHFLNTRLTLNYN